MNIIFGPQGELIIDDSDNPITPEPTPDWKTSLMEDDENEKSE
jgi:hypothetical protein